MGNKESTFTPEQLEAYEDCTFFTSKEILRVFQRYFELDKTKVPYDMREKEAQTVKLPHRLILTMPELKENPFKEQICKVFSNSTPGFMTFEEFMDMFSVFSEAAPREIKTIYAFKIYDWDEDGYVNQRDLEKTLVRLTEIELPGGGHGHGQHKKDKEDTGTGRKEDGLTREEIDTVVKKVLEEADLDDDGMLSYIEFEHVISRAPDFLNTFHIRI